MSSVTMSMTVLVSVQPAAPSPPDGAGLKTRILTSPGRRCCPTRQWPSTMPSTSSGGLRLILGRHVPEVGLDHRGPVGSQRRRAGDGRVRIELRKGGSRQFRSQRGCVRLCHRSVPIIAGPPRPGRGSALPVRARRCDRSSGASLCLRAGSAPGFAAAIGDPSRRGGNRRTRMARRAPRPAAPRAQSRVSLRCVTRCGRAASTPSRATLFFS